jgi:hypothetical protein
MISNTRAREREHEIKFHKKAAKFTWLLGIELWCQLVTSRRHRNDWLNTHD